MRAPTADPIFKHLSVKELHPTFGAEVEGVDFSKPVAEDVFSEVIAAMSKYGVCVFRKTGLDDERHVRFASQFGELDDITPYLKSGRPNRLSTPKLFDVGNIGPDGNLYDPNSPTSHANKGNGLFHTESSFNPRRAGYSLLVSHELPPPGTGGNTEFADTRTAFDELPPSLRNELLEKNYVACHSLWHSRKKASPEYFANINPEGYPFGRHYLVQRHEPSGRMTLYIAAHAHHIEGLPPAKSTELLDQLFNHATQPKYVLSVEWKDPGDMVVWDNTCTMHRAAGGSFAGKYKRDMRRATVHDGSSMAWGLNEHVDTRQGLP